MPGFMTEGPGVSAPGAIPPTRSIAATRTRRITILDWAFRRDAQNWSRPFRNPMSSGVFVVRHCDRHETCSAPAEERRRKTSLRQFGRDYHATQAATVVADLDGGVRAMVGRTRLRAPASSNRAGRRDAGQPGSSFKPYVYTTRAAERLQADVDRGRWPGLHRQLVSAELRPLLFPAR